MINPTIFAAFTSPLKYLVFPFLLVFKNRTPTCSRSDAVFAAVTFAAAAVALVLWSKMGNKDKIKQMFNSALEHIKSWWDRKP